MKYDIIIEKLAEKFIMKLSREEKERVLKAIYKLPNGNDIKQLKGKKSKGFYRLRIGDYRVIYTIDNGKLLIHVIDAGNRGQIYNRYWKQQKVIGKPRGDIIPVSAVSVTYCTDDMGGYLPYLQHANWNG